MIFMSKMKFLITVLQDFLMYAADGRIQGLSIDELNTDVLVPISNEGQPSAVDYLAADELIFWVDNGIGEMWRIKRDGSDKVRLLENLESPVGLAVDWNARNIYWTDDREEWISLLKL